MAKRTQEWAVAAFLKCNRILKDVYVNNETKCKVELTPCGHERYEKLVEAQLERCKECTDLGLRLTHQEASQRYLKCGFELLESYQGNSYNHLVKVLKCEHIGPKSLTNAEKLNAGCHECSGVKKLTLEQATERFLAVGWIFKDAEFLGIQHKHSLERPGCGHLTKKTLVNAEKPKARCKDCFLYKNKTFRRFADNQRKRLNAVVKNAVAKRYVSAVKDLGCTVEYFVETYIPSLFQPGMNWENYGKYGWHLDHIKPLVSFDWTNIEEQRKAVHYTNLQPLWARDNLVKGATY